MGIELGTTNPGLKTAFASPPFFLIVYAEKTTLSFKHEVTDQSIIPLMETEPKSVVEFRGEKFIYTWIPESDYKKMTPYNLVSTVCFNEKGEVLISCQKRIWRLPGGAPEAEDITPDRTAVREFLDETNVSIENILLLGGFRIFKDTEPDNTFYQLCYYAEVEEIHCRKPSEEEGEIFRYKFTPPEDVNLLIGWEETGAAMMEEVFKLRAMLHPEK
jgi:ADP-ribose pyrophosphatase YjhB (NUDIX family)